MEHEVAKQKKRPILSKRNRAMFSPWQQEAIVRLVKKVRVLDKKK